jgi:L-ascorbate metabolism protein UlaG (beta-lactamase superfamily)
MELATHAYYHGPRSDHFDGTRFFNPGQPNTDHDAKDFLRWRRERRPAIWDPTPPYATARPAARVDGIAVTMVGHASFLIQAAGQNILVDPVWSERASPVGFAGPRRANPPGIAFADLPPIDTVLITHNHYDHLDKPTITRLAATHRPRIVAPLGNQLFLPPATLADWGQAVPLGPITATLHPAYHWSARRYGDRRKALWCGYVLQTPAGLIYVVGDTGYGTGATFRDVRERFGAPTLAIIPIGAYEPRWFMRPQHVNPAEAVQIMLDCAAHQALGVHWGTFQLTDEARTAPAEALAAALRDQAIDPARFLPLHPAQVWTPSPSPPGRRSG